MKKLKEELNEKVNLEDYESFINQMQNQPGTCANSSMRSNPVDETEAVMTFTTKTNEVKNESTDKLKYPLI